MGIVSLLGWWYGPGWKLRVLALREKLFATIDYFSIDLLAKTFFSPFRQISAGKVRGPIGLQIRAFFDQLLSRVIGSIVRSIVICIGIVAIVLHVILGLIALLLWAVMPLAPFVGVSLALLGWMPWVR